jgi:DNA polymerase IV
MGATTDESQVADMRGNEPDGSAGQRMRPFCRTCLAVDIEPELRRCPACGSPRLVSHSERDVLTLAHIDCDAFFATIEKRDDPTIAGKPVIIGGGRRGVVSTCCYIARMSGVRSAMPMFKALAACPDAIVIRPDIEKYSAVGRQVRALMLEVTPLVEPVSIDEAFLDLSGTERLHHGSPALTLARLANRIESEIGITVSIGLSHAKFLAKIASDLDKPRGFAIIGRSEAVAFLADKPVRMLPGVGGAAARRLGEAGINRIGEIAALDLKKATALLGTEGVRLHRLANGIDPRKVSTARETKSVSAETTLEADLSRFEDLEPILWRMCEKTASGLKRKGFSGQSATLKLKTADFRILTRSRQLTEPTQLAMRLFQPLRELLAEACDGTRYRLIGAGLNHLHTPEEADRGDLADTGLPRLKAMDTAVDALRARFGKDSIGLGIGLGNGLGKPPGKAEPKTDEQRTIAGKPGPKHPLR